MPSLGRFAGNIAINDILLKTRFFVTTFHSEKVWCIFNHFYVKGPESYRVWRNNANYMAITQFKVIQFHRLWYQRKSTMRFPMSLRWSSYVAPKSPKGGSKTQNGRFSFKIPLSWRKSATKFLCVKTLSGKVVRHSLA